MRKRQNARATAAQTVASAPPEQQQCDQATLPPPERYSISSALLQSIANYFGTRPYGEVAHFVDALKAECLPQNGK